MIALLDAALEYAAAGLQVFPCLPRTKTPAVARGFYAATTNPETIRRYFRRPDCNVAIRTGAPSGLWVLDVDGDAGEESLRDLEARHGRLPQTREVFTPRGGRHVWFLYTAPVPCSTGRIGLALDVRGDGGYALVPPSVSEAGGYTWAAGRDPAVAPDWLVQLARKKPAPERDNISERALAAMRARPGASPRAYGAAALERECRDIAAMAPETGRNSRLNLAAFRLAQLVAGDELGEGEVLDGLLDASRRNGLVDDTGLRAVMATINSGFNAGLRFPRSRDAHS